MLVVSLCPHYLSFPSYHFQASQSCGKSVCLLNHKKEVHKVGLQVFNTLSKSVKKKFVPWKEEGWDAYAALPLIIIVILAMPGPMWCDIVYAI